MPRAKRTPAAFVHPDDTAALLPPIGHNSGERAARSDLTDALDVAAYLIDLQRDYKARVDRVTELLASANRLDVLTAADGAFSDLDLRKRTQDQIRMIRDEMALLDAAFKKTKAPVLKIGRLIDAFFNHERKDVLESRIKVFEGRLTKHDLAVLRAKQREEREAADAATARALELERQAALTRDAEIEEQATVAADHAIMAEAATQKSAADRTRVYGDLGSVSSMRTDWKVEVTDKSLVPLHLLSFNERAALTERKERDLKGDEIPGLRFTPEYNTKVR